MNKPMTKKEWMAYLDKAKKDFECNAALNKAQPEQEPWSPVSIGVDMTEKGAYVIGIYAVTADTSQIFYTKYYPVPQRTWVGLTDEERNNLWREVVGWGDPSHDDEDLMKAIEAKLKEKNT